MSLMMYFVVVVLLLLFLLCYDVTTICTNAILLNGDFYLLRLLTDDNWGRPLVFSLPNTISIGHTWILDGFKWELVHTPENFTVFYFYVIRVVFLRSFFTRNWKKKHGKLVFFLFLYVHNTDKRCQKTQTS